MQTDFVQPLQAAVLEHHPTAADLHGGEAPSPLALCGPQGLRGLAKTLQLPICG